MLKAGLIDEVRDLRRRWTLTERSASMRLVGYRQVWAYLEGKCSREEMATRAIAATRQLAPPSAHLAAFGPDRGARRLPRVGCHGAGRRARRVVRRAHRRPVALVTEMQPRGAAPTIAAKRENCFPKRSWPGRPPPQHESGPGARSGFSRERGHLVRSGPKARDCSCGQDARAPRKRHLPALSRQTTRFRHLDGRNLAEIAPWNGLSGRQRELLSRAVSGSRRSGRRRSGPRPLVSPPASSVPCLFVPPRS